MSINVEKRVQELIRHSYTGQHDTERLSPDGAATIVAAEIIAEAIKEAAPAKPVHIRLQDVKKSLEDRNGEYSSSELIASAILKGLHPEST